MSILDRDLIDDTIHGLGNLAIGVRIGLGIVLVVETIGISAAHMHDAHDMLGHAMKTALQCFDPKGQGVLRFAGENRLIHLNVPAACFRQRLDFAIQRGRQIDGLAPGIMVVRVCRRIRYRHWAGKGHLYWSIRGLLGHVPIPYKNGCTTRFDRTTNGRQLSLIRTIAQKRAW